MNLLGLIFTFLLRNATAEEEGGRKIRWSLSVITRSFCNCMILRWIFRERTINPREFRVLTQWGTTDDLLKKNKTEMWKTAWDEQGNYRLRIRQIIIDYRTDGVVVEESEMARNNRNRRPIWQWCTFLRKKWKWTNLWWVFDRWRRIKKISSIPEERVVFLSDRSLWSPSLSFTVGKVVQGLVPC